MKVLFDHICNNNQKAQLLLTDSHANVAIFLLLNYSHADINVVRNL